MAEHDLKGVQVSDGQAPDLRDLHKRIDRYDKFLNHSNTLSMAVLAVVGVASAGMVAGGLWLMTEFWSLNERMAALEVHMESADSQDVLIQKELSIVKNALLEVEKDIGALEMLISISRDKM